MASDSGRYDALDEPCPLPHSHSHSHCHCPCARVPIARVPIARVPIARVPIARVPIARLLRHHGHCERPIRASSEHETLAHTAMDHNPR